jgi:hypothetical protein
MGILDRIGETANKKKAEIEEGIHKEERYAAYKHPDVDYIVHGQKPFGPQTKAQSEESDEFASRAAKEKQAAAERAARNKEKNAERRAYLKEKGRQVAGNAVNKLKKAMADNPRPRQQRAPAQQQDVFGWGDGRNSGTIQIFGSGGSSVLRHSRQSNPLDMGFGSGKSINPLGNKKSKIRIW